eukprot:5663405-Amphidinium_carterae.1
MEPGSNYYGESGLSGPNTLGDYPNEMGDNLQVPNLKQQKRVMRVGKVLSTLSAGVFEST